MARFAGFLPDHSRLFSLPAAFVSDLLPLIDHLGELQVTLFCLYAVQQREGRFRYLLRADMASSKPLLAALAAATPGCPAQDALDDALDRAVGRGSLLVALVSPTEDDEPTTLYFINGPAGRAAVEQIARGSWQPGEGDRPVDILPERPTIYRLYEENIGPLTPMIAESLKDAEQEYSAAWVADAIRIAVEQNARSWRYIQSVLERWRKEGRIPYETAPGSDERDGRRFVSGKYADSSNINPSGEAICRVCGQDNLCDGLGYVRVDLPVDHPDFGKLFRCPNYPLDLQRREKLRKLGNLDAFTSKTFDTFRTDLPGLNAPQRSSLETALQVARDFAVQPQGWLLLEGTYGCGKTHLAAAVGNARLDHEEGVLFITTPDLLDHLRNTFGPSSEVGYDEMFDRLRNAPLLVLDDLGVENPSAWAQEKLFQLLNHRYARFMPTVITTNADINALDPRIRSRLLDDGVIRRVRISAPDYRTPVQSQENDLTDLSLYREMTFETLDVVTGLTPEERANLEKAATVAWEFAQQPQDWLLLMGNYGAGKTHLAASIANAVQERGGAVIFVTVADLLDNLRQTYSAGATISYDRRFQSIRAAPLLILDDLGSEGGSAWAREKLFQIVNYRYLARLPTVFTTSRSAEDLDPRVRTRLLDRRRCRAYAITAPDFASRLYRK